MYKNILFFLLAFFNIALYSQTIKYTYDYDASGNRSTRTYIYLSSLMGKSIFDSTSRSLKEEYVQIESVKEFIGSFEVSIFPNPNRGELVVKISPYDNENTGTIMLYGTDGKLLLITSVFYEFTDLDLTRLNPGNYILKVIINENVNVYHIVKE